MAVYTTLTEQELQLFISRFGLPALRSFQGSSSGVENTTYFLTLCTDDQFVLTVFETLPAEVLTNYIQLISILHSHSLPVPNPCIDKFGFAFQRIADKPALLFRRSPGKHIDTPTAETCYALGCILGKIHSVTLDAPPGFPILPNPCNLSWMNETLVLAKDSLDPSDTQTLQNQIKLYADLQSRRLPSGIIHGDLFRDNVLIAANDITAVIDFYSAGEDILLMDLAITANDWCYIQGSSHIECENKVNALLNGYQLNRSLSDAELAAWHDCLCIAAARFWLSRLRRTILPKKGGAGAVKDPDEYKSLLLGHLESVFSATN